MLHYDLVEILGDTAISAVVEDGLVDDLVRSKAQVILVTSQEEMARGHARLVTGHPNEAQVVMLPKPPCVTEAGWDDATLLSPDQRPFRYEELGLYLAGSSAGAQTRPDGAIRVVFSRDLPDRLWRALNRVCVRRTDGGKVTVRILVIVTTVRRTGSAALAPNLGHLQRQLEQFADAAEFEVDILAGTRSVTKLEPEGGYARIGRLTAFAELALAEETDVSVLTGLGLRRDLVTHCYEVGSPGRGQGLIPDEVQARRALALAARALASGGIGGAIRARGPYTGGEARAVRKGTQERQRFSGLGVAEIRLEPAAARADLAAHLLANLPPLP